MEILEDIRRQIDEIDAQFTVLFEKRMELTMSVAQYKKEHNLPILNTTREEQVVAKNVARLQNQELAPYYADFLRHTMKLSKQYQTKILAENTVAYQGLEGAFSHFVTTTLFPHGELISTPSFEDVFELVEEGKAAYGVVPFENSTTGDVSGVLDLCYAHNCYVTQMYDLPVMQNILAVEGATLADIKTVISHPQALGQSKRFLESLGVEQKPFSNTATAAKYVAEAGDTSLAAIASLEAGALYGLVSLANDIATEAGNTTRFIVISKKKPNDGNRFSLLVNLENKVGQLAKLIEIIAAHGFDMENIKSRPQPHHPWEYYFYIELVGSQNSPEGEQMMQEISSVCLSSRLLGVYNR